MCTIWNRNRNITGSTWCLQHWPHQAQHLIPVMPGSHTSRSFKFIVHQAINTDYCTQIALDNSYTLGWHTNLTLLHTCDSFASSDWHLGLHAGQCAWHSFTECQQGTSGIVRQQMQWSFQGSALVLQSLGTQSFSLSLFSSDESMVVALALVLAWPSR
jgi:hypothetical protein